MRYTIEDSEHAEGGAEIEADSANEAAQLYAENHCDDMGDGDESNFVVVDEDGNRWDATVEVEEIRHLEVFVMPAAKAK